LNLKKAINFSRGTLQKDELLEPLPAVSKTISLFTLKITFQGWSGDLTAKKLAGWDCRESALVRRFLSGRLPPKGAMKMT